MGFRPDIDVIADFFPKTPIRQTFLFSATVSPAIRQVAREVLDKDHVFLDVVPKDSSPVHAHIPQHFTVLPSAKEQLPHLVRLIAHDQLANPGNSKIMVFLNTTKQTQLFSTLLRELSKSTLPAHSHIYERRTGRAGKDGRADLLLLPFEQNFVRYQLSDVPIKEYSHSKLMDDTTTLAKEFESDPTAFLQSVKATKPSRRQFTTNDRRFRDKPSTALANLDTEVSGLIDQVDREAISEVFVSLLGFYFLRSGDMRATRRSVYEALQAWTTEACGLPKPLFVSEALLARMGGLDGGPPARSAQRGPMRRNFGFNPSTTRYTNSERNRRWNERTDREFARGPRREKDGNDFAGSRWSGRGSRSSRDGERRGGEWRESGRSGRSRDNEGEPWF